MHRGVPYYEENRHRMILFRWLAVNVVLGTELKRGGDPADKSGGAVRIRIGGAGHQGGCVSAPARDTQQRGGTANEPVVSLTEAGGPRETAVVSPISAPRTPEQLGPPDVAY